jgi:23S rRNA (uracil1939-C5)-methyltransferase
VFVEGGFPGDLVRARVHHRKRAYAQARVAAARTRARPVAPLADHPGAPWQVLRYERQLEIKQEQVDDALRRIGSSTASRSSRSSPAVEQWRYRNKLEYSFGTGADGRSSAASTPPGSWERDHHIEDCLLASSAATRPARGARLVPGAGPERV